MTHILRRMFLCAAAAATALPFLSRSVDAQAYPTHPAVIIVGYSADGGIDRTARLMARRLSERLGQPFTVENRPGPGTIAATEAVVRASADGYTLVMASPANTISPALFDNMTFNFVRDIAPVAGIGSAPLVIVVDAASPITTVADLLALAKRSPGMMIGSTAPGTSPYMSAALFRVATGINAQQTSYPSDPDGFAGLHAGKIAIHFAGPGAAIPSINAGELRAVAVTSATRLQFLPDTPTVAETVPGFDSNTWLGLGAPRNTPAEIVAILNREITTALADPTIVAQLADLGWTPMPMTPDAFKKFLADDTERWAQVVSKAGIKLK